MPGFLFVKKGKQKTACFNEETGGLALGDSRAPLPFLFHLFPFVGHRTCVGNRICHDVFVGSY